ncbi:hypothetical protein G9A89_004432 [Geosiphon pyriformis]|nr:hypothetical protein G9A89_004432 [Geosiphon pyriformis]
MPTKPLTDSDSEIDYKKFPGKTHQQGTKSVIMEKFIQKKPVNKLWGRALKQKNMHYEAMIKAAAEISEGFGKYKTAIADINGTTSNMDITRWREINHFIHSQSLIELDSQNRANKSKSSSETCLSYKDLTYEVCSIGERSDTEFAGTDSKAQNEVKKELPNLSQVEPYEKISSNSHASPISFESRNETEIIKENILSKKTESSSTQKTEWSKAERTELNDMFIAYFERRRGLEKCNARIVAEEVLDICPKHPGINLDEQVNLYLRNMRLPFRSIVLNAIQRWIGEEIKIRGIL